MDFGDCKKFFNFTENIKIMRIKKFLMQGILPVGVVAAGCGTAIAQDEVLNNPLECYACSVDGHQFLQLKPNAAVHVMLLTDSLPGSDDPAELLRVAAAFTGDDLHTVCGDHVVAGNLLRGYDDVTCTGHLLAVGNQVCIRPNNDLDASVDAAVAGGGYLFQQCLIVEDGVGYVERIPQAIRDRRAHIKYRAACIFDDGSFAVIQGMDEMYCEEFIDGLVRQGVKQALYLDMGTWAYGWYRERKGAPVVELAPRFTNTQYQTNWLVVRSCN
jgi:hypothetical protein